MLCLLQVVLVLLTSGNHFFQLQAFEPHKPIDANSVNYLAEKVETLQGKVIEHNFHL